MVLRFSLAFEQEIVLYRWELSSLVPLDLLWGNSLSLIRDLDVPKAAIQPN